MNMRKKPISLVCIALCFTILFGCDSNRISRKIQIEELARLNNVSRIEITRYNKDSDKFLLLKTIKNTKDINYIVKVFHEYSSSWQVDGFGSKAPAAPLRIDFYENDNFLTGVGFGKTRNNSVVQSPYYIKKFLGPGRPLSEDEALEILQILGLSEDVLTE